MRQFVHRHIARVQESLIADRTVIRFFSGVYIFMNPQPVLRPETFLTKLALVWFFSGVSSLVLISHYRTLVSFFTEFAVIAFVSVDFSCLLRVNVYLFVLIPLIPCAEILATEPTTKLPFSLMELFMF